MTPEKKAAPKPKTKWTAALVKVADADSWLAEPAVREKRFRKEDSVQNKSATKTGTVMASERYLVDWDLP